MDSNGYRATAKACARHRRPMLVVYPGMTPSEALAWLGRLPSLVTLNVAGNRESASPGIGTRAERWLTALFRRIRAEAV